MHLQFTTVRDLSLCGLVVLLFMTSSVVSAGLIHRRDASRGNNSSGNGTKSSLGASPQDVSISHVQERSVSSACPDAPTLSPLGVPSRAVCPFRYVMDCKPDRIPYSLMKAEAADSNRKCLNVSRTDARVLIPGSRCVLFNYTINVQKRNNIDGSWTDATQELPVSRICVFPKTAN